MSGHNKWSTIKHKKGRLDAARGKLFTKLIRELVVSAREGGGDVDGNPRLRAAVLAARGANMPKDTIERAVKRGSGDLDGEQYESVTYEGYGPGGVAFFVEALTSNRNRTVAEVRHAFSKHGGNLGTDGSVAWMFEQKGYLEVPSEGVTFEQIFEAAVEAGAEDVETGDELYSIYCEFTDMHEVANTLQAAGFEVSSLKSVRLPTNTIDVEGDLADSTMRLMDFIDDLDDVQNVYNNAEISDEEMERLSS
ncbi:MAG: YebC/PmpR family DNA-binding transcriptional regulator [Myxococcales bacterium]|nr:YebC/PmpR family DNA-binding transcriptional regulator [Myxococcales bacterium]